MLLLLKSRNFHLKFYLPFSILRDFLLQTLFPKVKLHTTSWCSIYPWKTGVQQTDTVTFPYNIAKFYTTRIVLIWSGVTG